MKRLFVITMLVILVFSCSKEDGNVLTDNPKTVIDTITYIDTSFVKDSILVLDTLLVLDTIIYEDTIVIIDTVIVIDSIIVEDTVIIEDTVIVEVSDPFVILWEKYYGGSSRENSESMVLTPDGGSILTGYAESSDGDIKSHLGDRDFWVIKLSSEGILEWEKSYGNGSYDYANCVITTSDGGYMVVGSNRAAGIDVTNNMGSDDFWVVKLNGNGDIQWENSFGGSGTDVAKDVAETIAGDFVITGYSGSNDNHKSEAMGSMDAWTIKIDNLGSLIWEVSQGGEANDIATSIVLSNDGGTVIGGYTQSSTGSISPSLGADDFFISKLDSDGNVIWVKRYGGSSYEYLTDITSLTDGSFYLIGASQSNNIDVSANAGNRDFWVVKIDENGEVIWEKPLGGSKQDYGQGISSTSDGGCVVTGYSYSNDNDASESFGESDFWVVKLNSSGHIDWEKSFGGQGYDQASAICELNPNEYLVSGYSDSPDSTSEGVIKNCDFYILRFDVIY